jgi:putative hydrolase of the HAD superfamily
MGMSLNAVVFDLDDTLVVDEAVSKEAMREVAALAGVRHGTDAAEFLSAARRSAAVLWMDNPELTYCDEIGISFEEALYGNLTAEKSDGSYSFASGPPGRAGHFLMRSCRRSESRGRRLVRN